MCTGIHVLFYIYTVHMYIHTWRHAKAQYLGVYADRDLETERGILFIEFHILS